jgi:hypothetical protein
MDLLDTAPTTHAGIIATIRYIRTQHGNGGDHMAQGWLENKDGESYVDWMDAWLEPSLRPSMISARRCSHEAGPQTETRSVPGNCCIPAIDRRWRQQQCDNQKTNSRGRLMLARMVRPLQCPGRSAPM